MFPNGTLTASLTRTFFSRSTRQFAFQLLAPKILAKWKTRLILTSNEKQKRKLKTVIFLGWPLGKAFDTKGEKTVQKLMMVNRFKTVSKKHTS